MKENEMTFEQAMQSLEEIVEKLEQGDVPLEEALAQFQRGVSLTAICRKKLTEAEQTLTKMVDENDIETIFENELEMPATERGQE